ncbi:cob(I)yrinic acid a,c-diamide adenosyltransferase [Clostridium gasigenes]|uniref:Cob(I)alamin adenosyltransferase n=1 Tax=Clostridium gasigenes TaxID=94869 RepID=A0A1H0NLY9_9CLOT|nr:cob(I)yrinic acid a,c-diamide adenosyltransferase [Clostridium gasigenes]MBB6623655.1 cob(I)yrinic acid a,c-diamide adenosyltransferase [Clostridium gasigenes]MBU3087544.1 cob(I)yrinic acid a,c-diamide adenosyltransferase [Clostridium gasigenes]MBU3131747.1 cob(I)yrinic acid a,c-diamide adenosyltransferase [Clostridium gasigenes]SDO93445.1 cob(I)alamin adenosyltransferase [Clostridium gasigenes]
MEIGLIHIYCGNGKGKTTAAMGLGMRCAGRKNKVLLTQFLKDNNTGELVSIEKLNEYFHVVKGAPMKDWFNCLDKEGQEEVIKEHRDRFLSITKKAIDENYDLLILDETMAALNYGVLELDTVLEFLKNKPKNLEVVLTGRNPNQKLIDIANYVSEINPIKHPFEEGIPSRIGIEM